MSWGVGSGRALGHRVRVKLASFRAWSEGSVCIFGAMRLGINLLLGVGLGLRVGVVTRNIAQHSGFALNVCSPPIRGQERGLVSVR